jgi:hypothetical protein
MSFGRQQTGFFVMTSLHFFIKIFLQGCDGLVVDFYRK